METTQATTASVMKKLRESAPTERPAKPQPSRQVYKCDTCKDAGYYLTVDAEDPFWHEHPRMIRCSCKAEEDRARRLSLLLKFDGLTTAERQRRFDRLDNIYSDNLIEKVERLVVEGRGMITLFGEPGVGKSTLLICAVNAGRERDRLAIYTTMPDLLSYLRSTFGPDSEDTFDRYWDALIKADILAIDELDEFSDSKWSMERFLRLIDERWRRMDEVLTLYATNARPNALVSKVRSRLQDGRAQIIKVEGKDMRGANEW